MPIVYPQIKPPSSQTSKAIEALQNIAFKRPVVSPHRLVEAQQSGEEPKAGG